MDIKIIIMDIDGTLFNSENIITSRTKVTLLKAQKMGIKLILASGRPTMGLVGLAKQLDMPKYGGLLVSYNGSKVVDCKTNETLFNQPLSIEEGKAVLEHMKNFDVYPMIDKGEHMYVNNVYPPKIHRPGNKLFNVIETESRGNHYLLAEQRDLAKFLDYEVNKILTAGEPEYLQENYQAMMAPFKDSLSCMFTAPFYFEYTAKGIDKAKALDTVLRPMGYIPKNLIAFGDGHNDASMVKYAGTGIAMANAVEALKEIADDITLSNDEDGIAVALEKYIPNLK